MKIPNRMVVTVKKVCPFRRAVLAAKQVNLSSRVAVAVVKVNPPNRAVVIVRSLHGRPVGAVTARCVRLLRDRGPALGRNNGMNGRAMGESF